MKRNLFYLFAAAFVTCASAFVSCGGDDPVSVTEYTVTVTASAGGTAQAGVAKAAAGTSVSLAAVANEGYKFSKWTVTSGGATIANATSALTSFSMPSAAVAVGAEFVAESTPTPTAENLVGSIPGTKNLSADITYTITGPVIVEDGATLTIPAGTTILANPGFANYILVLQGGKINVNGTAAAPVVMKPASAAANNNWGGLVINGYAPIGKDMGGGTTGKTEISAAYPYGGGDAADDSGVISYLILDGTGARTKSDVEHNGLTLNGVGSGTEISNVFVIDGLDDGIEFFGGTVDVENILVVNSDDDMFDFTQGWVGTLTNGYGIWEAGYVSGEKDPSGIEGDGNHDGLVPGSVPTSDAHFIDLTIELRNDYVDPAAADAVTKTMQAACRIRREAKATIENMYVFGTGRVQYLMDFVHSSTQNGDTASVIDITYDLEHDPDTQLNPATGYDGVTLTKGEAAGCDASVFDWVADAGYDIF